MSSDRNPAPLSLPVKANGENHQILVVEDEAPLRLLVAALLRPLNATVTVLASADEALEQISEGLRPSLLISDVLMPGTNGIVFAEMLLGLFDELFVLLISADPTRPGLKELTELPQVAFLEKPFSTSELLETLQLLLAGERAQTAC